jgi:GH18 family chitinase
VKKQPLIFICEPIINQHCYSPVAPDRGGIPEDFDNYVNLLRRLRERLNRGHKRYGLTLTLVRIDATEEGIPKEKNKPSE